MTIEHNEVTDPEIHEPKGISTATATHVYAANGIGSGTWGPNLPNGVGASENGSMFIADGAGSAGWERVQGWGQYQDTSRTVGSPTQTLSTGVKAAFVCDGGFLTKEYLPEDASVSLWDTSTNKHIPIAEDDVYIVRISFAAENYAGSSPYIDIALDIGGSIGEIVWRTVLLNKAGSTVRDTITIPVFTGSTYSANGGTINLTYTGTGTCDIFANDIMILRQQKAYS